MELDDGIYCQTPPLLKGTIKKILADFVLKCLKDNKKII